jgi:arsenate reductase
MDIIIYHNPACGTSRNALALIRDAGVEPHVIEYLKTPPSASMLRQLIERMAVPVRSVLREKEALADELGLRDPSVDETTLLEAMVANPVLINRPIVVTPDSVRLCRPAEEVLSLLPNNPENNNARLKHRR